MRLQEIAPFLLVAERDYHLIEERLAIDRASNVIRIANSTNLASSVIEMHYGHFTAYGPRLTHEMIGLNKYDIESLVSFLTESQRRHKALSASENEILAIKVLDEIGEGNRGTLEIYDSLDTQKAVNVILSESPNAVGSVITRDDLAPHESKYDGPNKYDAIVAELIAKRKFKKALAFAWLMRADYLSSEDSSMDKARSHVIQYLSDALKRRVEFMVADIPRLQVFTPKVKCQRSSYDDSLGKARLALAKHRRGDFTAFGRTPHSREISVSA